MHRLALVLLAYAYVQAATAEPVTFTKFDQNHSTIGFAVPILDNMSEVQGKFTSFSATLVYDSSDISKSSIDATIEAASIDTGNDERDEHLRSADFFDVEKHPQIRFRSTAVVVRGDQSVALGILSMRGVDKQIEIPFTVKGLETNQDSGKVTIGVSADFTLNRQDFGITWLHDIPEFVGNQIVVRIRLISRLTPREPAPAANP